MNHAFSFFRVLLVPVLCLVLLTGAVAKAGGPDGPVEDDDHPRNISGAGGVVLYRDSAQPSRNLQALLQARGIRHQLVDNVDAIKLRSPAAFRSALSGAGAFLFPTVASGQRSSYWRIFLDVVGPEVMTFVKRGGVVFAFGEEGRSMLSHVFGFGLRSVSGGTLSYITRRLSSPKLALRSDVAISVNLRGAPAELERGISESLLEIGSLPARSQVLYPMVGYTAPQRYAAVSLMRVGDGWVVHLAAPFWKPAWSELLVPLVRWAEEGRWRHSPAPTPELCYLGWRSLSCPPPELTEAFITEGGECPGSATTSSVRCLIIRGRHFQAEGDHFYTSYGTGPVASLSSRPLFVDRRGHPQLLWLTTYDQSEVNRWAGRYVSVKNPDGKSSNQIVVRDRTGR